MAEKDLSDVLLSSKVGYCLAFFNLVNCDRFQEREVYGGRRTRRGAYFFGAFRFLEVFVLVMTAIILRLS
jgi:hypothetical protein